MCTRARVCTTRRSSPVVAGVSFLFPSFSAPACKNRKTLGFKNDTRRRTCNAPRHTRARRAAAANGRKCGVRLEIGPCAAVIGDPSPSRGRMAGRGSDATASGCESVARFVGSSRGGRKSSACGIGSRAFQLALPRICHHVGMPDRVDPLRFAWLRVYYIGTVFSCLC